MIGRLASERITADAGSGQETISSKTSSLQSLETAETTPSRDIIAQGSSWQSAKSATALHIVPAGL